MMIIDHKNHRFLKDLKLQDKQIDHSNPNSSRQIFINKMKKLNSNFKPYNYLINLKKILY